MKIVTDVKSCLNSLWVISCSPGNYLLISAKADALWETRRLIVLILWRRLIVSLDRLSCR